MLGNKKIIGIYVFLIIASFIFLLPFAWITLTSFKTRVETFAFTLLFTPTLRNYINVLSSPFINYAVNSLVISTSSVLIALILGMPAAYLLSRYKFKYRETLYFFILTIRMGPAAAFAVPFYLLYSQFNMLDTHIGVILIYQTFNLPFVIWMLKSFIDEVPVELDEAAKVDGCSVFRILWNILLPLLKPAIFATSILSFIFSWNEFFMTMVLTSKNAKTITVNMPSYIGFTRIRWEEMCAASTLAILPIIVFAILTRKYLVRGLTLGAVKG